MASQNEAAGILQPKNEFLDLTRSSEKKNPYVFLVGCPRSGTTMLKRMVNAHPLVAITRETHWIPRFYEKQRGVTAEGNITPRLVDKLFEHHRFEQMKFKREKLQSLLDRNPEINYSKLVSQIFDHYGERKNKPIVGDKTPNYVRKIPVLHKLWPSARFVHLIRDGREVWLSIKNWRMAEKSAGQFSTWQSDPLVTTALWWKALVGMGRRDGAKLDESLYQEVQYQNLVIHPEQSCKQLSNFLNLPYADSMDRYYEGRTQFDNQLSTNAAWLPPTPGRRNWQKEMTGEEIERFEAAAGDLLEEIGFARTCPCIRRQVQSEVDALKAEFAADVDDRWSLPQPW